MSGRKIGRDKRWESVKLHRDKNTHVVNQEKRGCIFSYMPPSWISYDCVSASSVAVQKLRLGSVAPKESDLHGAAQALIRLQVGLKRIPTFKSALAHISD